TPRGLETTSGRMGSLWARRGARRGPRLQGDYEHESTNGFYPGAGSLPSSGTSVPPAAPSSSVPVPIIGLADSSAAMAYPPGLKTATTRHGESPLQSFVHHREPFWPSTCHRKSASLSATG